MCHHQVSDYTGIRLHRCRVIQVSDYTGIRLHRCGIIQVSDYTNIIPLRMPQHQIYQSDVQKHKLLSAMLQRGCYILPWPNQCPIYSTPCPHEKHPTYTCKKFIPVHTVLSHSHPSNIDIDFSAGHHGRNDDHTPHHHQPPIILLILINSKLSNKFKKQPTIVRIVVITVMEAARCEYFIVYMSHTHCTKWQRSCSSLGKEWDRQESYRPTHHMNVLGAETVT